MPNLSIPLTHGQNEGIDAKLLPNGLLTLAENIRFRKDGRIGSRYGYDFITGAQSGAVAAGNFGASRSVYFKDRVDSATPAKWWDHREDGAFTTPTSGSCAGALGVPRRIAAVRQPQYQAVSCDIAYVSGYAVVVYHDYDTGSAVSAGVTVLVFEAKSMKLLSRQSTGPAGARNPRAVVMGSSVMILYNDGGNNIQATRLDAPSTFTSLGTIVTAVAGAGAYFDACPSDATHIAIAYHSAATTLTWGYCTGAGVFAVGNTLALGSANLARVSITTGALTGNIAIVIANGAAFTTGNASYATWTSAGVAAIGLTVIDATGAVCGFPVAGQNATDDYSFAWNIAPAPPSLNGMGMMTAGKATAYVYGVAAAARPFSAFSGTFVWAATYTDSLTPGFGTYKLVDVESPYVSGASGNWIATCEAVSCQHEAMSGGIYIGASSRFDNRRSTMVVPQVGALQSMTATISCLPVSLSKGFGADVVRIESGPCADKLLPANMNGQLFFSGARIREFDGSSLYESGMGDGCERVTLASAAGAIAAGTYQYCVVWGWFDRGGRRHRAPPSLPVSITLGIASNVTVSMMRPPFTDRAGLYADIYRTKTLGSVFYLVNSTQNLPTVPGTSSFLTYVDSATDATIVVNEVLYTQGARGGLSGLLPNDEPPPARFIWAGNDRLFMGGLEDPTAVQWSKLVFPGEPMQFSINAAFRANVDAEVTAIAALDGTWFVFTRDSVWSISGEGPDDTGNGSFSSPRRLPSDVGCISQRSVLETSIGLFFQARNDRMYVLPRGGGAPQWVGQAVRDTLADFPQVMWARLLPDENLAVWAVADTTLTHGRLIIYDLRIGEWSTDNVYARVTSTLDAYGGKLVLDGLMSETSAFADDDTGAKITPITMSIQTGDIRPFGPSGWGRCRKVFVLGEFMSATQNTVTTVLASTQSGPFDLVYSWTLTGTSGDKLELSEGLPVVRGDSFRFLVSTTPVEADEGIVLNALTLEVFPQTGTPRLSAGLSGG